MNQSRSSNAPLAIVIFGASGDLTKRKLVPALFSLTCQGLLPEPRLLIGVARTQMTDEQFRDRLFEGVQGKARLQQGACASWPREAEHTTYLAGKYDDPATYQHLQKVLSDFESASGAPCNRLFHLALPPEVVPVAAKQLGNAGLNQPPSPENWARLVIEKPFGHDEASARQLNDELHSCFQESQIYRIDHYLGKETVQNILTLRFANTVFEPLWAGSYIDHVQITAMEKIGIEGRCSYYNRAGVLRDMFQSHLLQLLTFVAMDPPANDSPEAIRDEKVRVLQSVRPIVFDDVILGQYRGYEEECGVPGSRTPTYGAVRLYVDSPRWKDVPFYLRSGKKLARKATEVSLQYQPAAAAFLGYNPFPNTLTVGIQPDEGIHLRFEAKVPGAGMRVAPVELVFHYGEFFGHPGLPDAYERLLLDAVEGDPSLFARADEIELAWHIIDPLTRPRDVQPYDPDSWGPTEVLEFMARDNRLWLEVCGLREEA